MGTTTHAVAVSADTFEGFEDVYVRMRGVEAAAEDARVER